MFRPGIVPWSSRPLANTLLIWPVLYAMKQNQINPKLDSGNKHYLKKKKTDSAGNDYESLFTKL